MNDFLGKIAGLCLIRMLMDWALPEGDTRQYADLGMGLVMMLCMMQGLGRLLQGLG